MVWQKRLAKEWLLFLLTFTGIFLALFLLALSSNDLDLFFEGLFNPGPYDIERRMLLIGIVIIYFIRITVWSIKKIIEKEETYEEEK